MAAVASARRWSGFPTRQPHAALGGRPSRARQRLTRRVGVGRTRRHHRRCPHHRRSLLPQVDVPTSGLRRSSAHEHSTPARDCARPGGQRGARPRRSSPTSVAAPWPPTSRGLPRGESRRASCPPTPNSPDSTSPAGGVPEDDDPTRRAGSRPAPSLSRVRPPLDLVGPHPVLARSRRGPLRRRTVRHREPGRLEDAMPTSSRGLRPDPSTRARSRRRRGGED